jgi:hypothetical protein
MNCHWHAPLQQLLLKPRQQEVHLAPVPLLLLFLLLLLHHPA